MSKLDKDTVLAAFTKAYEEKHGKAPDIEASGGWYSVDGGKKVRLAEIDAMSKALLGESADESDNAPVKQEKAKPNKVNGTKKGNQFSVKDFYAQQILSKNPGSKSPR
ncbi:MAG: hypothetical protein AAGJ37_07635 [Pseudomonadota bacterium]